MVGHERPAGGREMVGGSPLANAAFRVFRQAILEIEVLYERRNLADLRPVLQDSTPIRPGSTQARVARKLVNFSCRTSGQFPVPSPRIVLKSVQSSSA